jgi:hypothetical protein
VCGSAALLATQASVVPEHPRVAAALAGIPLEASNGMQPAKHPLLIRATSLLLTGTLASVAHSKTLDVHRNAPASAYDAEVLTAWFQLALSLTQHTAGFSPPVAARAFGYLGVTAYESIVPGIPAHRSLAGQLNELNDLAPLPRGVGRAYHWPAVANAALAEISRDLYATTTAQAVENRQAIDALEVQYERRFAGAVEKRVRGSRGGGAFPALWRNSLSTVDRSGARSRSLRCGGGRTTAIGRTHSVEPPRAQGQTMIHST